MSRSPSLADVTCPVSRAISVFQEKWVLHIVHTLLTGPRGFNELGREVGGCNPTTLTTRLARLEELGLVQRLECDGGRSAYALTAAGQALREVIDALHAWSLAHLPGDCAPEEPYAQVVRAVASTAGSSTAGSSRDGAIREEDGDEGGQAPAVIA